jgi:hypothetical protein
LSNNRQEFQNSNTSKTPCSVNIGLGFGIFGCYLYSKASISHIALVLGFICSIAGLVCVVFSWNEHRKKIWMVSFWLTIIVIILYVICMFGFSDIAARVLADILMSVIWILLLWCTSISLFFLIFSPQRKSLSEKYLFIGRIKDLMKYISSLVALFAGGYFGWLIGSELDRLEKKISDINEVLAKGNGSHMEKEQAWRSAVSNVQDFVIDQVNVLLSFLFIIFAVWIFVLVVDLVRARMCHSLMDAFEIFESVERHMLADRFKSSNLRVFSCIKRPLLRFYKWYKRKAQSIAENDLSWFSFCLIAFWCVSIFALNLLELNLQVGFKNWFISQTNQMQPSY